MNVRKLSKLVRFGILTGAALIVGFFISIKTDDASRKHSILLDFDTQTASADAGGTAGGTAGDVSGGTGGDSDSDSGSSDCGAGASSDSSE